MAQAQKKPLNAEAGEAKVEMATPLPLAFWSSMAEMQRQYLATLAHGAVDRPDVAANANVAEPRPDPIAAPAAIGRNWMAAAVECQRELASFMNERLSKNQAFFSSAASVAGFPELVQLQAGWLTQTAQDYTNELGKLSDIVKNGADEALAVTA